MIVYILTTILLSILGYGLYAVLVRNRYSWKQQKGFLVSMMIFSFLFPLLLQNSHGPKLNPNPLVKPVGFGQRIDQHSLQSFCKCERPDHTHRIKYHANAWLNVILANKKYLSTGIFSAVGLVVLLLCIQFLYLKRLVNRSRKQNIILDGAIVSLLYPRKAHGVGAFWLKGNYVIWSQELNKLQQEEQEAILRHELSHLKQKDTWLKALIRIVQCFWLINPIFYLIRRELDLLSECIADEEASRSMSSSAAYAKLLLKVKSWQMLPLTNGFKGSKLSIRIHRLMEELPQHSLRSFAGRALLLIVLQASLTIPLANQLTDVIYTMETYEQIYHKIPDQQPDAIYCQDCETVCKPIEDGY
ncbi:MAG: M56 family metallopeptidase [Bacteroidota bacterium]